MPRLLLVALALGLATSAAAQPSDAELASARANVNCAQAEPLALDTPTTSTLAPTVCEYIDGTEADFYVFRLDAATEVTVTMASAELDSYLGLYEGSGLILDSDDDSGGGVNGFDSQIVAALEPGVYIVAANHIGGADGEYTVTVSGN